jgi:twitching motility protein PilI
MSKLDLRSFQQEISERLAAARRTGSEAPRLCFIAGAHRFALPLADISEVAPVGSVRNVPGTAPWFMGVTNVRGAVIALTHIGALLDRCEAATDMNSRVLVLGGIYARLRAGFLVNQIIGLRAIKKTTPLATAQVWGSQTATDAQDQEWTLLDLNALFQSTPFLEVSGPIG